MFKKILFGMSALAMFAACTEDYTDWAMPQSIAPVEAQPASLSTLKVEPQYLNEAIDLASEELANVEEVKLFTAQLPDNAKATSYTIKLTDTGNNEVAAKYDDWKITADETGCVSKEDLQAAVEGMFGKGAVARSFNAVVATDLSVEGKTGTVAVAAETEPFVISVIPVAPEFAEFIYEIGNSHGWSTSMPLYSANSDGKYQGYYYLDGGFKFKPHADDWDGDWGQDPNADEGNLVQDGEQDCQAAAGFYQIDVDLAAMTWKITEVTSISIIGTVNGNWDTDTDLVYNTDTGAWEVTTELTAGAMKFRMNHDWAISWGGANGDPTAYDNLTQNNGKDLDVTEAGTYFIQLFITYEGNNKVVITKQ